MTKKEKLESNLLEGIMTVSSICCSKCGKSEEIECDQFEMVDYLIEEGWHATSQNIYCPSCNKKRNKK